MSFVSCVPCCLCLWVVHSCLPLQGLLCCIVFCLSSFCIICSTLDCPFSLLCCIVLWLSSFCILCSILHVSLGRPLLFAPLVYCVAFCFDCLLSVYYAPYCMCHWVVHSCLPLKFTVLHCVLLVFFLYLTLHIGCVSGVVHSWLSLQRLLCCIVFVCLRSVSYAPYCLSLGSFTLDCPFNGYFVVLCFVCVRSVSYAPCCLCLLGRSLSIVPSTVTLLYCVLFVFVLYLMLHISFDSWVVYSCLTLQRLLCCIVFVCLRSVSYAPYCLSLGSSTLDCPFNGYFVV